MDCELLAIPDVADVLEARLRDVRSALADKSLVATVGDDKVRRIPRCFLDETVSPPVILPALRGTIILLRDGGMTDDEVVAWLLDVDETLAVPPIVALRAGRIHEVRRVASALAL